MPIWPLLLLGVLPAIGVGRLTGGGPAYEARTAARGGGLWHLGHRHHATDDEGVPEEQPVAEVAQDGVECGIEDRTLLQIWLQRVLQEAMLVELNNVTAFDITRNTDDDEVFAAVRQNPEAAQAALGAIECDFGNMVTMQGMDVDRLNICIQRTSNVSIGCAGCFGGLVKSFVGQHIVEGGCQSMCMSVISCQQLTGACVSKIKLCKRCMEPKLSSFQACLGFGTEPLDKMEDWLRALQNVPTVEPEPEALPQTEG